MAQTEQERLEVISVHLAASIIRQKGLIARMKEEVLNAESTLFLMDRAYTVSAQPAAERTEGGSANNPCLICGKEAGVSILALRAQVAELAKERDQWKADCADRTSLLVDAQKERDKLEVQVSYLRAQVAELTKERDAAAAGEDMGSESELMRLLYSENGAGVMRLLALQFEHMASNLEAGDCIPSAVCYRIVAAHLREDAKTIQYAIQYAKEPQ